METLQNGLWWEDFYYYGETSGRYPASLDYTGDVGTTDGWVTLPGRTGFTLALSAAASNEDLKHPYATGAPSPGYLRFPVLGWNGVAGAVLRPVTTAAGKVTFALSFSGAPQDRIYLLVRPEGGSWATSQVLTNTAGFGWRDLSINLPKGRSTVAVVLKTANGPVDAQIDHRLRLTSLRYTSALAPSPGGLLVGLIAPSTLAVTAYREVFAAPSLQARSAMVVGSLVSPRVEVRVDSALTVTAEAGAEAPHLELYAEPFLAVRPEVELLSASATGGFMLGSRASFAIESTLAPELADRVRPLLTTSVVMTRPSMVKGRPITPRARSRTASAFRAEAAGTMLDRISPTAVNHTYPAVSGGRQPAFRWLSIDAQRKVGSDELESWPERSGLTAPAWTTPGAFRPTVADYRMATDARHAPLNHPAVVFDSSRLDHLNIELPEAAGSNGEGFTWVLVGSFTRFRGMLRDSCPIIDFTADAAIDYSTEAIAERENLPEWFDAPGTPSFYTGWTAYSDSDPATSMLAYRGATASHSTRMLPYRDTLPVVLSIVVRGGQSFVQISSIMGTGASVGRMTATTPREVFDPVTHPLPTKFTLGKSRHAPPFGGLFGTGSMSLLEVAYYDRVLTPEETTTVSNYLAGVYAPASLLEPRLFTPGGALGSQVAMGDLLFTTDDEQPWRLLTSGRAEVVSDATSSALQFSGMSKIASIAPEDYAFFVAQFGEDPE